MGKKAWDIQMAALASGQQPEKQQAEHQSDSQNRRARAIEEFTIQQRMQRNTDHLVDAGRHLVAVLAGEALDIDHDAGLAVRDFEGY